MGRKSEKEKFAVTGTTQRKASHKYFPYKYFYVFGALIEVIECLRSGELRPWWGFS